MTVCDPMDCSLPDSSGISQARILEWVAIPFSRGIFPSQGWNPGLLHCRQFFTTWTTRKALIFCCSITNCHKLGDLKQHAFNSTHPPPTPPPPPTPAFEVHAAGLGSLLQASQDVSEYGGWTESVGGFGEDSAPASFALMGPFLAAAELRPLWASVIAALTSDVSHVGVSLIALLLLTWDNSLLPWWPSGKESACNAGDQVGSLGQEYPLEKGMATHSSFLAWGIPWTEEPGGLQSMESQRVRHDWATNTFTLLVWLD